LKGREHADVIEMSLAQKFQRPTFCRERAITQYAERVGVEMMHDNVLSALSKPY
jgi:hypothetical protein